MSSREQAQEFVFINKTPGKLARTNDEKFLVAAHIGKTTRQKRPARPASNLNQPKFHIAKFVVEERTRCDKDRVAESCAAEKKWHPPSSREHDQPNRRHSPLLCCPTHPQHPNLSPVCFKGNSDPFSSTSVSLSSFMWDIVQAAFRFLVFSSHPSTPAQAYRTQLGDFVASRLPIRDNVTCDVGIHAILAAGYLVKASTATSKEEETALILQSERYKLRCISRVRRDLNATNDLTHVIVQLRLLISIEFFTADYRAASAHLRGLKTVCSLNAEWYVSTEDFIIMADIGISLATLSKTELDPTDYDPGPRSAHHWNQDLRDLLYAAKSRRPEKCDRSALRCLGEEIDELSSGVDEVVETVWMLTNGTAFPDQLLASTMGWLSRRTSALASRLLKSYADEKEATQPSAYPQMKNEEELARTWMYALKAAVSIMLLLFLTPFSMEYVSEGDFSRVSKAVEPMLRLCSDIASRNDFTLNICPEFSKDLQDIYLWVVCLCALNDDVFCARGHTKYSGWARQEFETLCGRFDVREIEVARTRLKKCMWSGSVMDEFLSKLMGQSGGGGAVESQVQKRQPLFTNDEWAGMLWRQFVGSL